MIRAFVINFANNSKIEHELNKEDSLQNQISNLCQKFNITGDVSSYLLQQQVDGKLYTIVDTATSSYDSQAVTFSSLTQSGSSGSSISLTLILKLKPHLHAQQIIQTLQNNVDQAKKKAIFDLRQLLHSDSQFGISFVGLNGIPLLITFCLSPETIGNTLAYSLNALEESIIYDKDNSIINNNTLLIKIISCLQSNNLKIIKPALQVLLSLSTASSSASPTSTSINNNNVHSLYSAFINYSPDYYQYQQQQQQDVNYTNKHQPFLYLIKLLTNTDIKIQTYSLNLINNFISYHNTTNTATATTTTTTPLINNNESPSSDFCEVFLSSSPALGAYNFMILLQSLGINTILKGIVGSSDVDLKKQIHLYQRYIPINFFLQRHLLSIIKSVKDTPYSRDNSEHEKALLTLWNLTFGKQQQPAVSNTASNTSAVSGVKLTARVSEQWKLLGFQGTDPATDFRGMGCLGLYNFLYFAVYYYDDLSKILINNIHRKERDYPTATAGINITGMLVDLFNINSINTSSSASTTTAFNNDAFNAALGITTDATSDSGANNNVMIYNVLFDHFHCFEELYCITFKLLDLTWDEMEASYMDFPRVIAAVKKKLSEAILQVNPYNLKSLASILENKTSPNESNSTSILSNSFAHSATAYEDEDEWISNNLMMHYNNSNIIKLMRNEIKKSTLELIKQQKINVLKQGTFFKIAKMKLKQQQQQQQPNLYSFFCLSSDGSELVFSTPTSSLDNKTPDLLNSVPLREFGDVIAAPPPSSSSSSKQQKKIISPSASENTEGFTFSLQSRESTPSNKLVIEFIALNKDDYLIWTDGLQILLNDVN